MKKIFFILSILVTSVNLQSSAQFLIGPQAGVSFATLTGTSLAVIPKVGWHVGTFCSIPFSKHLSLMPAILYVVDGYKYHYTTTSHPTSDSTVSVKANVNATLGYLDIPVLLNYFTGETKGLMIQAGLQLSILVTDNSIVNDTVKVSVNGGNPQPTNPTDVNKVTFDKTDILLVGGLGYKFSQLVIIYARVATGFAKAQQGTFVRDTDTGHSFVFEAGAALSFGAK